MKRLMAVLLLMMLAVTLLPAGAMAVDLDREGSIRVRIHTADDVNVQFAKIELHRIGEPRIENNNLVFDLAADYAASGADLSDLSSPAIASTIDAYIAENEIAPYAEKTSSSQGVVRFNDLPVGLYLVRQNGFIQTCYFTEIEAFSLTVPMTQDSKWVYNIEASPKVNALPKPTATPKPTRPPQDGNLPQTGMVRWPVIAMAMGGLVLFSAGWACFMGGKRKRDA